jgi:hypothetical protein
MHDFNAQVLMFVTRKEKVMFIFIHHVPITSVREQCFTRKGIFHVT